MKKVKWWEVYRCENVYAVEVFTRCIPSILDRLEMAPVRTFQSRRHYASWLSEETKDLMAARDQQAMANFNRTGLAEDWDSARTLRNQATRLLKSEKCRDARKKVRS